MNVQSFIIWSLKSWQILHCSPHDLIIVQLTAVIKKKRSVDESTIFQQYWINDAEVWTVLFDYLYKVIFLQ